jgi:hypothetical protein
VSDYGYSMPPYFKEMPGIGKSLSRELKQNIEDIKKVEADMAREVQRVKDSGKSSEAMNKKVNGLLGSASSI